MKIMKNEKLQTVDWILIEATLDSIIEDENYDDTFDWFKNINDTFHTDQNSDVPDTFSTILTIYRTTLIEAIKREKYEIAEKIAKVIEIEENKTIKLICEIYNKEEDFDIKEEYLTDIIIIKVIHKETLDMFLNNITA